MFSDTFAGIAPSSLLVPALIAILGKWNWWLPRPARRLLQVPAPPPAQPASHAAAGTRR